MGPRMNLTIKEDKIKFNSNIVKFIVDRYIENRYIKTKKKTSSKKNATFLSQIEKYLINYLKNNMT